MFFFSTVSKYNLNWLELTYVGVITDSPNAHRKSVPVDFFANSAVKTVLAPL